MRCSGDAASRRLQDQGEDVGEDEDPCVKSRAKDAELGTKLDDDVFQGQVDARGDEGGSDDQAADLGLEAVAGPRVGMHHDAADVANGFGEAAEGEGDAEGPCPVADALDQLDQTAKGEERAEESVGAEIGCITVDGQVHGAVFGDVGAVFRGLKGWRKDAPICGVRLRTQHPGNAAGLTRIETERAGEG